MSVVAVLAPTNTGKTHRAVERMLESRTGMIGLPLRLLAREVYDRVTARIGESEVALLTGEEKRVPPAPRYFVCTVESMPVSSHKVDFLAVDEIQLCAHHQRGHVFTDRLLNARGREATWFLGADTIRPLMRTLVPEAEIRQHPRMSRLSYAGQKSLRSLPPRSAVVGFSADQVYLMAERLRERRGGVAVVLGALSPRTRNAQVALYQSGEVQYMVATDAIGMGLNMDVDHVAFGALSKYDGREDRPLAPAELAQIAGRAGRHHADGTFGTLTSMPRLRPRVVRAIENHRFAPIERLVWRNSELDMRTVETLLASLARPPGHSALELVHRAEDQSALFRLSHVSEVRERAVGTEAVSLLWQVCQIPDFRKLLEESHVRLLREIFAQLTGPAGHLDADWMAGRIRRLDDVAGDIDTLMNRIAFVRTWTYVSHRADWVRDATHWRERTRAIEDRLSDALHQRLMARFVARRRARVARTDEPMDERNPFSKLGALLSQMRASEAGGAHDAWVEALIDARHEELEVDGQGAIHFREQAIARITRGVDLLRPEVTLMRADLGAADQTRIARRLTAFVRDLVVELLGPLRADGAARLSGAARGLIYQLEQGLGTVLYRQAADQVRGLSDADRRVLRHDLGVRVGRRVVYLASALEGRALTRRRALGTALLPWGVTFADTRPGATSMEVDAALDQALYTALGYPVFGPRGIRADMVERVQHALHSAARSGRPFEAPMNLPSWLGCKREEVPAIVSAFGYRQREDGRFAGTRRPRRRRKRTNQSTG